VALYMQKDSDSDTKQAFNLLFEATKHNYYKLDKEAQKLFHAKYREVYRTYATAIADGKVKVQDIFKAFKEMGDG